MGQLQVTINGWQKLYRCLKHGDLGQGWNVNIHASVVLTLDNVFYEIERLPTFVPTYKRDF